ncbi:hypothetical protein D9H04_07855 [Escherichia coli]|nr:hypothetical protein [Escherichia coli]EEW2469465.1 hypothetical protein [Escherichia coli]EGI4643088.1 hypothetical protein [Escherichia coli]MGR07691.1 hypothetical protein [Escherichia coli]MHT42193.1 hypothetical protein [Escherichia coli]
MSLFSQLSHVKVLALAGALAAVSVPTSAEETQYLMTLVLNGQPKGEFLVSRDGEQATVEASLWRVAGVNAESALPLDRLNDLGRVRIVWSEQTIYFYPYQVKFERRHPEPETVIEPKVASLDLKSLDYYLTHHSRADEFLVGSAIATGRAGRFDLDLRAGIGGQESYFSSQWHDEENSNVKDIELGRVQRYGLDGLSLTNESHLAAGSFSTDRVELYWPVGTRVDVLRDGAYLESITLESEPSSYSIQLDYSNNRYEFRAVLPDGRTDTRTVERTISGRLAPVGKLNYRMAAGQDATANEKKAIGYVSYGLTGDLSLFAGQDEQDRGYVSSLYSRDNLSFESTWFGNSGYALNGSWQNDHVSAFARVSDLDDYQQESLSFSYRGLFRPTLQYSSRTLDGYSAQDATLRIHHNAYLERLRTSISISPFYSLRKRNEVETDAFGGSVLVNLPEGWQSVVSYEHESYSPGSESMQRFQGEVSKRFSLGRLTYRYTANDFGHGWKSQQQSLRIALWNWEFATLSASMNRSSSGADSISLSISGSFGRTGFQRIPQRSQATLMLSTCRDLNADGVCQEDEPEVKGVIASVDGHQVKTPAIIDSLTPYRRYDIEVSGDFGLSPRYKSIQSGRLVRGGINHLRLPLSEVREIEGQLDRDGIRVALVDAETGDVLAEQTTEFGGWYLFYSPTHKKVKVVQQADAHLAKNFHM